MQRVAALSAKKRFIPTHYCARTAKLILKAQFMAKGFYGKKAVMKIILLIALVLEILIIMSGAPFGIGLIIGLIIYGVGHALVQRVQKIRNYHHK